MQSNTIREIQRHRRPWPSSRPAPLPTRPRGWKAIRPAILLVRPQQWVKNVLLFAPLLLAHHYGDPACLATTTLAFAVFCGCASSVYVINDWVDREADRRHPRKCRRPLASGEISPQRALAIATVLWAVSFAVSLGFLSWRFNAIFATYFVLTSLYTFWLKRKIMVDVLLLAGLYTLRVLAGGAAAGVPVSQWFLAFSVFLFSSLALAKRYAELARLADENQQRPHGRGYQVDDLQVLLSIGPTNGYLAVLVFALYINSDDVSRLYPNVQVLWLVCPLLLYWVGRLWMLAKRRLLSEDPVVFAIRDRVSLAVGAIAWGLAMIAAHQW
ncbi:MAG: UbiA family prenyltransferase [Rhodopirellula sp.]|nr:UbiA family prenyltransferase [Rhodopirellula sp.]